MKIIIKENMDVNEPEIVINCKSCDDELVSIITSLKNSTNKIIGLIDGKSFIISPHDILYFDSVD